MASPQITRDATALFLSALLICAPLSAQRRANLQRSRRVRRRARFTPLRNLSPPSRLDPKRAQKAVETGEKAEAEGRSDEALAAYDEAARYAPQNMAIVARSATLRSQLVRAHIDNAEQLGARRQRRGRIAELRAALRVDATNSVVAERIAQMEAMQDDDPLPPRPNQSTGLPRLKTQERQAHA